MLTKEYIFVSKNAVLGGIETLMVRMANEVVNKGHKVTVVCPDGPVLKSLEQSVTRIPFNNTDKLEKVLQKIKINRVNHITIWLSHPHYLVSAYIFQKFVHKKWKVTTNIISGIFLPKNIGKRTLYTNFEKYFIHKLPPVGTIYFMSEAVKHSFAVKGDKFYENFQVTKLAAPLKSTPWKGTTSLHLRIVSVGRLTRFKAYNFGAIQIVESLREQGIQCDWTIWGDGEELEQAKECAKSEQIAGYVKFMGPLPYNDFVKEINKYDIFVGLGTAALEASACGMPTLIAIADSKFEAAGYLYEAPSDSIGENIPGMRKQKTQDLLLAYSQKTVEQRSEIGQLCLSEINKRMSTKSEQTLCALEEGLYFPSNFQSRIRMGLGIKIRRFNHFCKFVKRLASHAHAIRK